MVVEKDSFHGGDTGIIDTLLHKQILLKLIGRPQGVSIKGADALGL